MIQFERVTFSYPNAESPVLADVSLTVPDGEMILVMGPSGAGKSTLLRCINGLVPHFSGGRLSGAIRVGGLDPVRIAPQGMSHHVGFVFQDPESQFVMDRVEDEIAFALENAAIAPAEMRVRVEETLDLLDLAPLRERALSSLSGGEQQRVAIAAVLALRPKILVLDEPTSQLDPKSAEDVLSSLVRLNADLGLTVLLAEHRLERVLPYVDQILYVPEVGGTPELGEPRKILANTDLAPPLVRLSKAMDWQPMPLTIKEGRRFSRAYSTDRQLSEPSFTNGNERRAEAVPFLQVHSLVAGYGGKEVLHGVSLHATQGEIVAVMGRNGSGKTTLLKSLVALVSPSRGDVRIDGKSIAGRDTADICRTVAYLPQDPSSLLFADTVREELEITLRNHGMASETSGGRNGIGTDEDALLRRLGIARYAESYPRDLSAGERQRSALAAITITEPRALLLDEPTRGLDYAAKQLLVELLHGYRTEGIAIIVVTHDVEFAAQLADRVVLLSQGEVLAEGATADVLGSSPLFAPQIAKLFPGSGWLTVDEALSVLETA
jgi:energy-coupling factor transporter ATP-binding protein EcfA2